MQKKHGLRQLKPPEALPPSLRQNRNKKSRTDKKDKPSDQKSDIGSSAQYSNVSNVHYTSTPTTLDALQKDARVLPSYKNNSETVVTDEEAQLQQFDVELRYGPCRGLTRLQRFNRAVKLGLNPPEEIRNTINKVAEYESIFDRKCAV